MLEKRGGKRFINTQTLRCSSGQMDCGIACRLSSWWLCSDALDWFALFLVVSVYFILSSRSMTISDESYLFLSKGVPFFNKKFTSNKKK